MISQEVINTLLHNKGLVMALTDPTPTYMIQRITNLTGDNFVQYWKLILRSSKHTKKLAKEIVKDNWRMFLISSKKEDLIKISQELRDYIWVAFLNTPFDDIVDIEKILFAEEIDGSILTNLANQTDFKTSEPTTSYLSTSIKSLTTKLSSFVKKDGDYLAIMSLTPSSILAGETKLAYIKVLMSLDNTMSLTFLETKTKTPVCHVILWMYENKIFIIKKDIYVPECAFLVNEGLLKILPEWKFSKGRARSYYDIIMDEMFLVHIGSNDDSDFTLHKRISKAVNKKEQSMAIHYDGTSVIGNLESQITVTKI